jgi:hypothetical protein
MALSCQRFSLVQQWIDIRFARFSQGHSYRESGHELRSRRGAFTCRTSSDLARANALALDGEQSGKNESLAESIGLYSKALDEYTYARVPFDWSITTCNQGVALMLLAERRGDAEMARLAVQQIEAGVTKLRDGVYAPSVAFFEARLPMAHALAESLAKR